MLSCSGRRVGQALRLLPSWGLLDATTFTGLPARDPTMFSTVVCIILRSASVLKNATCEVMMALLW